VGVADELVQSNDIGEAERMLRRVYPVAHFHETRRPFSFSQQVRGDDRAALARFSIDSWTEIHVDFEGSLSFGHLIKGAYRATSHDVPLDVRAPFLFRPGAGQSQSEGLDLLMVNLDERALAEFAGHMNGLDGARLRIHGLSPRTNESAVFWRQTVDYVRRAFDVREMLANDLVRHSAVETLFAAALTAFPIEVVGRPVIRASDAALPSTVRRALSFIDEHLDQPIGVEDVAAAARVSVRALQAAFRRNLDTSPAAAIRTARLAAVHADLVSATRGEASVAAIARRWGFAHLGRFAAEYRAQYGELPRETLR